MGRWDWSDLRAHSNEMISSMEEHVGCIGKGVMNWKHNIHVHDIVLSINIHVHVHMCASAKLSQLMRHIRSAYISPMKMAIHLHVCTHAHTCIRVAYMYINIGQVNA